MKEKILVVDDDPAVLQAYQRNLRCDFELVAETEAQRALERLQMDGPFAVVLSDCQMPAMDGLQLLSLVRDRSPDTSRVLITAYPTPASKWPWRQ